MADRSTFSLDRGFLPKQDPLLTLSHEFAPWEQLASELPKLLVTQKLRIIIDHLPILSIDQLTHRELERAMLLLSFIGHSYVWGGEKAAETISLPVAKPWYEVAAKLQRPPVLSYASYALNNWRRINQDEPIALGNIALLQNFYGGLDEEWFVLIHVDIEMKAATVLNGFLSFWHAVANNEAEQASRHLKESTLANPTEVGTGGTPFMSYLRKHKDETLSFLI